jgi:hypothetical protein
VRPSGAPAPPAPPPPFSHPPPPPPHTHNARALRHFRNNCGKEVATIESMVSGRAFMLTGVTPAGGGGGGGGGGEGGGSPPTEGAQRLRDGRSLSVRELESQLLAARRAEAAEAAWSGRGTRYE